MAHAEETDLVRANEDLTTMVQDLLCNIMHLCDLEGVHFNGVLSYATTCYEEEKEEDNEI